MIKNHFWPASKNKQEAYKNLIDVSRNDDCAIGNSLYYLYHQNYYKLIGIDLSRQTNITQQINFIGKLEEDDGAAMLSLLKRFLFR